MEVATFPRANRLLSAAQYKAVFSDTQFNYTHGAVRMRSRLNSLDHARIGLVVPKRGTPTAVRRNRLKRISRDKFRLVSAQLPAVDIVLQIFNDMDDKKLAQALDKQFLKLINDYK